MTKTFTCIYYTDPGHGWFKVKRSVLHNLGIADQISLYSYQRGDYVYLEEDCDAFLLHQALKEQGTTLVTHRKHTDNDSRIRTYERYRYVAFSNSERDTDNTINTGYDVDTTEADVI